MMAATAIPVSAHGDGLSYATIYTRIYGGQFQIRGVSEVYDTEVHPKIYAHVSTFEGVIRLDSSDKTCLDTDHCTAKSPWFNYSCQTSEEELISVNADGKAWGNQLGWHNVSSDTGGWPPGSIC